MNKKKSAKIRFYSWLTAAAVLTLILILGISGVSFGRSMRGCSGFQVGYSYPNAGKYKAGDFTLDEEIDELEVNWISGTVTVKVTEGDKVYAKETEVSEDDEKMRYLVENGKLIIQYQKAKIFSFGNWSKAKDLTVYIPRDMAQNMKMVDIETTSADVDIKEIHSKSMDFETVSGEIEMKDLAVRTLDIEGVSGDIRGSSIQAEELNVEVVSGSVDIGGVFEKADMEGVSGNLKIECDGVIKEASADTVSGDITLYILEENGFTAELDSVSGDLNTEFTVSGKKDRIVYKDGKAKFDFETVSGDVWIKKR